ncbi:MAG TPA: S9 family peptidase [Bacteroidetes bacterium]|nr:S9 family peptidase [Bacteroidota bacterium]
MTMQKLLTISRILIPALFVMVLAAIPAIAQRTMTPEDIAAIQNVGFTQISPDGAYVAYTLVVPADPKVENRAASTHLYVYSVVAGSSTALITTGSIGNIAFRPEKGTITFTSRRDGDSTTSLYEISTSGGEATKLFAHNTNLISYSWADDGNHVMYIATEVVDKPSTGLPYEPELYEEFAPNRKLFIQNVMHEDHEPHQIVLDGSVYNAVWSPDRSKIAVSVAPTPNVDDMYMSQQVHVLDYKTREVIASVENAGKLGEIHWSPDGSKLALRAAHDLNDPTDGRIMVVSAEGGKPLNIAPDFKGKFEQIMWNENDAIHFIASEGVWSTFGAISPDGSGLNRVLEAGGPILTRFSPANDGTIAFTANTSAHPAELYLYKGGELSRITNSNEWLSEIQMGTQEVVKYTARDGEFEIEGILFHPVNKVDGQRYPLITVVHGGPEAHLSNGWLTSYSNPGHFGAGQGYAVFYPNYRGSTGRGIEFTYSSQADMAGKEFDDIVDGVDYLIESGLVDGDRVGVTGGSYGGYATAWMSTYYSERFAAGVMFVGISNNLSKWGTSDIPEELYHVHARKRIWDDWEGKLKSSPVYWVERSQTPLLIMHGKEDTRVHPAQSMELFRHLKVRKPELPVQLVYYPGEGHGNTRSTSRYDYTLRMIDWFNTHLSNKEIQRVPGMEEND